MQTGSELELKDVSVGTDQEFQLKINTKACFKLLQYHTKIQRLERESKKIEGSNSELQRANLTLRRAIYGFENNTVIPPDSPQIQCQEGTKDADPQHQESELCRADRSLKKAYRTIKTMGQQISSLKQVANIYAAENALL